MDVYFFKKNGEWICSESFIKPPSKNKYTICLDFDGVVVDPSKLKSHYLKKAGYPIKPSSSNRETCLRKGIPLSIYRPISSKVATKYLMELPIKKDAIDTINSIYRNYHIYFITARNKQETIYLLKFIDFHQLSINGVFSVNDGSKLKSLSEVKANIFIDDSPHKLRELLNNTGLKVSGLIDNCKLFLFENVANQNYILDKDWPIKKIKNWNELDYLVSSYDINV
jgi:uncharacterized HAD superfamily protein